MKRLLIVLLLLIANAIVTTSKMSPPDSRWHNSLDHLRLFGRILPAPSPRPTSSPKKPDERVARAAILPPPRTRGRDGCIAL